jgi:hypothetical protein
LHAENVVVRREEVHGLGRGRGVLDLDGDLRVIDTREVARAAGLVFFRLKREGVGVDARHRGARVVGVRLDLVEVLTTLRLHAVLAVEDQLELIERTDRTGGGDRTIFADGGGGVFITEAEERGTSGVGDRDEHVGVRSDGSRTRVRFKDNGIFVQVGGEVPEGRVGDRAVVESKDELLHRVVEREAHLLGGARGDRVGASVLHLLDEVLVALLRESAALLGVQEVVVGPALEGGVVRVVGELGREVNIDAAFVVLQRNKREGKARVAVEPEDERQVDGTVLGVGRHLGVVSLLGFGVVQVVVQTPPLLEVAINALSTNGDFDVLDGTLGGVDGGSTLGGGAEARLRLHFEVHVLDQVTVAGDRDRDATVVGRVAVDGLFNNFGSEVAVSLVNRLEEGNLRVSSQVNILRSISDQLHKTTGHSESCLYYTPRKKFWPEDAVKRARSFLRPGYMSDLEREEGEIVEDDDVLTEEEEDQTDIDIDMDDMDDMEVVSGTEDVLASTLATPEGDTVCTALLRIGDQLEMQNKILIKILSKIT